MKVNINGKMTEITKDTTVVDLIIKLCGTNPVGVAVAKNGQIIRRSQWNETTIEEGDSLEILHATSGG